MVFSLNLSLNFLVTYYFAPQFNLDTDLTVSYFDMIFVLCFNEMRVFVVVFGEYAMLNSYESTLWSLDYDAINMDKLFQWFMNWYWLLINWSVGVHGFYFGIWLFFIRAIYLMWLPWLVVDEFLFLDDRRTFCVIRLRLCIFDFFFF